MGAYREIKITLSFYGSDHKESGLLDMLPEDVRGMMERKEYAREEEY